MTPSLEGWPTKSNEAPSPHEVRLAPLNTNPVFQSFSKSDPGFQTPAFELKMNKIASSEELY